MAWANLLFMAKLLHIWDPHGCKQVYCFESCEGLSTFSTEDGSSKETEGGTYRGSYEELRAMLSLRSLEDDVVIKVGDILNTLPELLKNDGLSFSFVYCDTDLYAPTRLILNCLHPRLSKGGIFVMDEWNYDKWPGEALAVREFMAEHSGEYDIVHVRSVRQPTLALRKVR